MTTAVLVLLASALSAASGLLDLTPLPLEPHPSATATLALRVVSSPGDARASARLSAWHGGATTAADGDVVDVLVSDAYSGATNSPQAWASFFSALVHGPELASAHVLVAPLAEVQAICGPDALGCYGGDLLVIPGDLPSSTGVTPAEVARHEYGHHLGLHRVNPPWRAIDWGTKRWATAMGICRSAQTGAVAPGDEDARYAQNPGEGLAESYRVLNELVIGLPFTWDLLDAVLRPTDAALAGLRADVLTPWTAPTERTLHARFVERGPMRRTWNLELPLDGLLRVDATFPPGSPYHLVLRDPSGALMGTGQWSGARSQAVTAVICGSRTARLEVVREGDPGAVQLRISTP